MKRIFFLFIFIIIIAFNLLVYIEKKPLIHEEPRRAIIAQEMLISGNYIVPTVFSVPYLKKPPLHNWAIALLSLKDKVVTNFADRFPSVLSLLLMGILMLIFIKDKEIAFISSLVVMSNYLMLYSYGNKSEPDMMLTLFTFLSFLFYIKGVDNLKYIFISSFFMGCGILTKGVSPLFFYPGIILFILFKKEEKFRLLKYLGVHFIFSLVLPLVWIILYYFNGDISNLLRGLNQQATDRAKGGMLEILKHFTFFPFMIFVALLPWSFLLFFYKSFNKDNKDDLYNAALFCFLASFLILAILPGGRGRYFMPAVPYFAIVIGYWIRDLKMNFVKYENKIFVIFTALFLISVGWCLYTASYLQLLIITLIFLIVYLFYKYYKGSLIYEIALLNLVIFTLYIHTYDYYKVLYYYNYKEAAKKVVENIGTDLPLIVGEHWAMQLLFNYERITGKLVYDEKINRFDEYIYMSSKDNIQCDKIYEINYSKKSAPWLYFYRCQK